ncbi:hypothetical protein ACFFRR_005474 [Megaselia abdita]
MREEVILGIDALEKLGFRLIEEGIQENPVCVLEKERNNKLALTDLSDCELIGNEVIKPMRSNEILRDLFSKVECCGALTADGDLNEEQKQKLESTLEVEFKKFENIIKAQK